MIKSRIRVMLPKREMTQKQLVEITGIRQPTVSKMCTSTISRMPMDALDKICKALDCQPGDLFEYIPDEN